MLLVRKFKIINENQIRDLTKPIPPEGFCAICGKKDEICNCEKYNCKCGVLAINCKWPECLCQDCLEISCVCIENE